MKWCLLFSYFTKTCLKLQYGICSPRQMHIKWNWTMNSWLLSAQCLKGKYITNEFHREKIWTFSITVIPIESLSQITMKLNPIFPNRYSAKKAAFLKSSRKWSQSYIMRKKDDTESFFDNIRGCKSTKGTISLSKLMLWCCNASSMHFKLKW